MIALVVLTVGIWTGALLAIAIDINAGRRCIQRIAKAVEEESRRG